MREKLDRIEPNLILLSRALRLSNNQMQMLRGLVLIEEPYRICRDQGDSKRLATLEKLSEYRILEPSLLAIDERFDGAGPLGMAGERIPLLARALHALFALDQDGGRDFTSDSGQFDPEIVGLVSEFDSAA